MMTPANQIEFFVSSAKYNLIVRLLEKKSILGDLSTPDLHLLQTLIEEFPNHPRLDNARVMFKNTPHHLLNM
jgi:hypothetical protein